MKRIITIFIILAALAGVGYYFYQRQAQITAQQTSSLQTVAASQGSLTATIGATGVVRAQQTALLFWKTSGTVEAVSVNVGDNVLPGDILATLEQTSLPQNVILAQAELVNAQKALNDLKTNATMARVEAMRAIATYAQAVKNAQYQVDNFTIPTEQAGLSAMEAVDTMQKRLDEARVAFEPYKFYPEEAPIRKDLKEKLDQAQADYNAAVKRLEYEYQLDVATANLEKARQDYEKWKNGPDPDDVAAINARMAAAEATLNQVSIKAPFAGEITEVDPQPGDQVSINTQAFRLDNLKKLLVDVQVSEIDINQIRVGQDSTFSFDAILGREYHGNVNGVSRVGNPSQGVVDFLVTIELTDADENVKPGMTAAVNIVVNQIDNVLLVPNRAVRLKDGQRVVYVLADGQLNPVSIELGASSDTSSQVLTGDLKIGDLIVLNPPLVLDSSQHPGFIQR
jgi:HlyD family secretion protein